MRKIKMPYLNVLVVCFYISILNVETSASQVHWTGLGGDTNWSTPANWSSSNVPTINDTAYFDGTAFNCSMNENVNLTSLIFTSGYTGQFSMGHTAYITGDVDFSTGGSFFTTTFDTLYFTGSSIQTITGKPGVLLPVIVKDGTGTLDVISTGFRSQGLILKAGILANSEAFNDTVGDLICMGGGGQLSLNSGSIMISGDADFKNIQNFADNSGIIYFNGVVNRTLIPNPNVLLPAIHKVSSYNLTVTNAHLRARSFHIIYGQVIMDTSFRIDSLYLNPGATLESNFSGIWKDTIQYFKGKGNLNANNSEFCFTGDTLSCDSLSTFVQGPSGALSFTGNDQIFIPMSNVALRKVCQRGTGTTTLAKNGMRVDTLKIISGELNLGSGLLDSVSSAVKMLGGTLNFGSSTLRSGAMNLDMSGPGTIVPSNGTIELIGSSTQYFIPPASVKLPHVKFSGFQVHVKGNRIRTSKFDGNTGVVIMDTAMNADTLNINPLCTLSLDNDGNQKDTVGFLNGMGVLNFGNTVLHISNDANFEYFTSISGIANIEFDPVVNSMFRPKGNFIFNKIKKIGNSALAIDVGGLRANYLDVSGGTFDWGTSYNDTIYDTLFLKNATMVLGYTAIMFRSLVDSNSSINFKSGSMIRFGGDGTVDLSKAQNFAWEFAGGLHFNGSPGSKTKFIPPSTYRAPPIQVNDSGLIDVVTNLNGSSFVMDTGNWNWGENFNHTIRGITVNRGSMIFNNSVIAMDSGNIYMGYNSDIRRGTGTIILSAQQGHQMISSQSDSVLPNIQKTDTSTIEINSELKCQSYKQTAGKTWFYGNGITASSHIIFENVDSIINLGGITLKAGDSIRLSGSAEKPLYCNPGSQWFIDVPQNLRADFVVLKNSVVTGTNGIAYGPSVDSGGNTNWVFWVDIYPPDNDLSLQLVALDTGRVRISWNPSVIDSTDAESVGIRYSSSSMPTSINDESAILLGYYPLTRSVDTVINLNAHTTYYFAAAVSDTSGNWSDFKANASTSIRTKAIAPEIVTAPTIIHTTSFPLSWKNPPGLDSQDLLYLNITDTENPSIHFSSTFSSSTTSATVTLPSKESNYSYILSSSQDSAGIHYIEDTYAGTVQYSINPPVFTIPEHTFDNYYPVVSWQAPADFSSSDTFFVHTDTINGTGTWVLKGQYIGSTRSHNFSFISYGSYKIMVSTNWDKTGQISPDNVDIDTIYLVPPATNLYSWDVSQNAGYQIAKGTWGSDRFWSVDGRSLTGWPGLGYSAQFIGAASNAVITISGTQYADSIIFDAQGITLSGGTLNLSSGIIRGNAIDTMYTNITSKNIYKTGSGEIVTNGIIQCDTLKILNGNMTINRTDTSSAMIPGVISMYKSILLNGSGRIARKVNANSGSVLTPGGAAERSMTIDELCMFSGCTLNVDVGAQYDTIVVKDKVTLAGYINIRAASGFKKGVYPIINCSGTIADSGIQILKTPSSSYKYSERVENGGVVLYVDTLIQDTAPPKVSINLTSGIVVQSIPGVISGTAYDSLSGILSISILISKNSDTTYWNGTSWQKSIFWMPLQQQRQWNYSTAGMVCSDGKYSVKTGATDSVGNIGYDTTYFFMDGTAPVITKLFDNLDTIGSWTGLISGEADDPGSMIKQIAVSVKNDSGKYYDGTTWSSQECFLVGNGTNIWSKQINRTALIKGIYTVLVIANDTVGNKSVIPVVRTFRYFTSQDIISDKFVANLHSAAVNCSTALFYWNRQYPILNDSVWLALSKNAIPSTAGDGEYNYKKAINDTSITVTNISGSGLTLYARLFLKDNVGNYNTFSDSGTTILKLPDCVAPKNMVSIAMSRSGDTLTTIQLKAGNQDSVRILFGTGLSKVTAVKNRVAISNKDTVITVRTVTPGMFYCIIATMDMSGNSSPDNFDSIVINNSKPSIQNIPDTTVIEGKVMTRQVSVSDLNDDSLLLSLIHLKDGMSIDKNVFRWTPRNSDVGVNTVIIECKDTQGAASRDTFTITVNNVPEPPVVTYDGVFEVHEDNSYNGTILLVDPDFADTSKVTIVKLPAWMTISLNKLTGTPTNEYIGVHQVELIYTDRDSLRDTLAFQIKVINTNDKPVIESGSIPDTLTEKNKYTFEFKISDVDDGDSVTMKNAISKTWIKINSVKRINNTKDWTASIAFSPGQTDTGSHDIKFEIADRSGETVYYAKKIRILDADDPPGKPSIVRKIAVGAVQYTVSAADDRDNMLLYSVKMKALRNDSIIYKDSSVRLTHVMYPLTDGKYLFNVVAIDGSGLKSDQTGDTISITGSSEYILKDTNWGMISIPSKKFTVANLKNTGYLLHWDESGVEKQVYSFYKTKDELSEIELSKAYWRKGFSNDTIHLSASDFVKEPVTVSLKKTESGWNQIASPFPYPVSWSRKSDILWKWNSKTNDYEEVQNVLEPWYGYWVRVDSVTDATLSPVPVFSTGSLTKLRKTYYLNKNNWMIQVSLRSTGGNDIDNKFGVNQNANDQYDELDRPEPPAIDGRPLLYFKHSDWKKSSCNEFASDIRKNWKSVNIFEITLEGVQANGTGKLNFSGLENISELYIFTKMGDSILRVDQSETYTIPLSNSISYQTVFVTDNAGFLNSFPLHFKMSNPYPNPFCPTTKIEYTLPYRWESDGRINLNTYNVSVEIYDIMGRKLRTLVYRKMVPGNYSLRWDGKMENGRVVASGKYFCVLKADNLRQVKNLTLMK
jgi:hypothetical protein